jgi:hypothetical protein
MRGIRKDGGGAVSLLPLLSRFRHTSASPVAALAAGLTTKPKDVREVVPAQREGFDKAFISANAWWAIGIAEKHRVNLRWIAP